MSRATYAGIRKHTGKRPFVITRACYAGSQKYSTVWTGDNQSLWSHLQMMVPQICNLGMSGFTFCGADVGGFGADCTPELLSRWVEAACFSPLFRNHSCQGSKRQEPWQFGDEVVAINVNILNSVTNSFHIFMICFTRDLRPVCRLCGLWYCIMRMTRKCAI